MLKLKNSEEKKKKNIDEHTGERKEKKEKKCFSQFDAIKLFSSFFSSSIRLFVFFVLVKPTFSHQDSMKKEGNGSFSSYA